MFYLFNNKKNHLRLLRESIKLDLSQESKFNVTLLRKHLEKLKYYQIREIFYKVIEY